MFLAFMKMDPPFRSSRSAIKCKVLQIKLELNYIIQNFGPIIIQKQYIQTNLREATTDLIDSPQQGHWGHLFSMCEKHIEKTLKAHWRTLGETHWKTHWKALEHIITHCTLQHIGDSAAFSNVPPMCPVLNVQEAHWKLEAHWRTFQWASMCL